MLGAEPEGASPLMISWIEASSASTRCDICTTVRECDIRATAKVMKWATYCGRLSARTYRRISHQAARAMFPPASECGEKGRRVGKREEKRTNAVSSCGLEMSAGLASGFEGPGEAPRDATGVLEP